MTVCNFIYPGYKEQMEKTHSTSIKKHGDTVVKCVPLEGLKVTAISIYRPGPR